MDKSKIENLLILLRKELPSLGLEQIVDDITLSVKNLGIQVKYADMSNHETKTRKIAGYTKVSHVTGRPIIVLNGDDSELERRLTLAHQLGHILLHWKWMPGSLLLPELTELRLKNHIVNPDVRAKQANDFMMELLMPVDVVFKTIEAFTNLPTSVTIRESMIANTLANTLKVPEYLSVTRLLELKD